MSKPQMRPALPLAVMQSLPERAAEALALGRFREAIDLFKQLLRQERRAEWKAGLDDAYCGRARDLAAKQMFKEAAMLLENTRSPDGALRDPLLYAACVIREGQQGKAAAQLLQDVCGPTLPANDRPAAEALLAALLTVVALPAATAEPPERLRWREGAAAARQAITAWVEGVSAEEMEKLLSRISLRSAFRPVRLLLKALLAGPDAAEKSRPMLETIGGESPFFPWREAVEAALGAGLTADGWNRLTPLQQAFVAETAGMPATAVEAVTRLSEAAAHGPAVLFNALQKRAGDRQQDADPADLRSACLNLLPQIPDRMRSFEKQFGPLSPLERARAEALAAEAQGDLAQAEAAWLRAAHAIAEAGAGRIADLSRAIIFRHLAELAAHDGAIRGDGDTDPVSFYLARAELADPGHVQTVLARIARFRNTSCHQDWHRLADEAAQRFPQDSQVLLQATQSAVARQAYKKAAGYARRLLAIDPINPGLRHQMVELQVAQARKQVRAKRPDLAARALEEAAQWERPEAPSALLRLFRGLVAFQEGNRALGELLVRQAVDLAGGGVGGWFRAMLETLLTKTTGAHAGWLRQELARARQSPPAKDAVQAVAAALVTPEAIDGMRAVASLLDGMRAWLVAAADLEWSLPEFQALEDKLLRHEQFAVLQAFARAGLKREPGNRIWRFHAILARTCNEYRRMTIEEEDELEVIGQAAAESGDAHMLTRLRRYMAVTETMQGGMEPDLDDVSALLDSEALLQQLLQTLGPMPKQVAQDLRAQVAQVGREATVEFMAAGLANAPDGPMLTQSLARRLAEVMLTAALERSAPPGRKRRS